MLASSVEVCQDWPDSFDEADADVDWIKRRFKKGEIDRAGKTLTAWWTMPAPRKGGMDTLKAYTIVENWRTSHSLPLNVFQAALRHRAARIEHDVLVSQRLKRWSSTMNKLAREPQMKLTQMHDLGGCRAILSSVKSVYDLCDLYRDSEVLFETESSMKCYDYIKNPKDDGYRSIHVVGRYSPRIEAREPWSGYRIEIQLRSQLQHAFATAVETVTTFTRQPLKFGGGPEEWRRFFSLMGSAIALRENTALVPGTPSNERELILELRDAATQFTLG